MLACASITKVLHGSFLRRATGLLAFKASFRSSPSSHACSSLASGQDAAQHSTCNISVRTLANLPVCTSKGYEFETNYTPGDIPVRTVRPLYIRHFIRTRILVVCLGPFEAFRSNGARVSPSPPNAGALMQQELALQQEMAPRISDVLFRVGLVLGFFGSMQGVHGVGFGFALQTHLRLPNGLLVPISCYLGASEACLVALDIPHVLAAPSIPKTFWKISRPHGAYS